MKILVVKLHQVSLWERIIDLEGDVPLKSRGWCGNPGRREQPETLVERPGVCGHTGCPRRKQTQSSMQDGSVFYLIEKHVGRKRL